MERLLFGTDGIRGTANIFPITSQIAERLARAIGRLFIRGDHRHRVVIGKDTRLSGYMLEPALTAGFIATGMDVTLLGPLPTPGVALLTRSLRGEIGVMITASHNTLEDNGFKIFGPDGFKLSDEAEAQLELAMMSLEDQEVASAEMLGRAVRLEGGRGRYMEALKASLPSDVSLAGVKIVVDCANGAAYSVGPRLFWELGAEVIEIGTNPNGFNINVRCGSSATEATCAAVLEYSADLGIALDGGGQRVVLIDETGHELNGDQILAILATEWHRKGILDGNGVVATLMSNSGLEVYLRDLGLKLHRTQVGDRYVADLMRSTGHNLGGEQSGRIIMLDFGTTADGLLTSLQTLAILRQRECRLSEAGRLFQPFPQALRHVPVRRGINLQGGPVRAAIDDATRTLGRQGRVVVRKSGTEPLIRIMVEAEDEALMNSVLDTLLGEIEKEAERASKGVSHSRP